MLSSRRVTKVRDIESYRLELSFHDGITGELDLESRVACPSGFFRPLADVNYFPSVKADPEAGMFVWPNGVHFCPSVLHSLVTGKSIHALEPPI